MRILRNAGLLVVLAVAASAQHRGGGGGIASGPPAAASPRANTASPRSNYGSLGGFGNVLYPGTGHAPGTQPPPNTGSGMGTIQQGRFRRPNHVIYPVLVGGYYGYPYGGYYDGGYGGYGGYGYQGDPGAYSSQPGPQVVINQNFTPDRAYPVVREYAPDSGVEVIRTYEAPSREPVQSNEDSAAYYLLAFKDSSVYSAFAYWVEGDTLHYVTSERIHNQASLNLVDRDLTDRLNRDRNMQVKLPR